MSDSHPVRKLLLVLLAAFLLAYAGLSPLLFPQPCPVTKAAFYRIEIGMSLREVVDILGVLPGDYATIPPDRSDRPLLEPEEYQGWAGLYLWEADEGDVYIVIGAGNAVSHKRFHPTRRLPVGPLDLLHWRFARWRKRAFGTGG